MRDKLLTFYKLSAEEGDITEKTRSPEAEERFKRIIEKYINTSGSNGMVDLSNFRNLTKEEKIKIINEIANIDEEVFSKKYPDGYYESDHEDIKEALEINENVHGFYITKKDDPEKICGYIYGSEASNHMDEEDFDEELGDFKEKITNIKEVEESFKSGKIFYVENLASTSGCGRGLIPVGSLLMIRLIQRLREQGFKYIAADLLPYSYEVFKTAVSTSMVKQLGVEVILDILDDSYSYSTHKILVRLT